MNAVSNTVYIGMNNADIIIAKKAPCVMGDGVHRAIKQQDDTMMIRSKKNSMPNMQNRISQIGKK